MAGFVVELARVVGRAIQSGDGALTNLGDPPRHRDVLARSLSTSRPTVAQIHARDAKFVAIGVLLVQSWARFRIDDYLSQPVEVLVALP